MKDNREFCLGNFTVEPGKKKSGFLRIGGGEFQLPATILHGEQPGKTVLITAGIHAENRRYGCDCKGCEPQGI